MLPKCPKMHTTRDKMIWNVESGFLFVGIGWVIRQRRVIHFFHFLGTKWELLCRVTAEDV